MLLCKGQKLFALLFAAMDLDFSRQRYSGTGLFEFVYPLSSSSFCHGLNTCRSDESSGIFSRRHTKSVWFNPMTIFMRQCVSPYAAFGNPRAA